MKHHTLAFILGAVFAFFIDLVIMSGTSPAEAFNMKVFDTTWSFDQAQIDMPDGTVVEGHVDSWKDYDDSDSILVTIDGKTYYTHLSRAVLIDN